MSGTGKTYEISGDTTEWEDILIKKGITTKEDVLLGKGLNPEDVINFYFLCIKHLINIAKKLIKMYSKYVQNYK